MEITSVFTSPPEFTVLHGRAEIGRTDPSLLADREEGPRLLLLAGRNWRVTWIDWRRRRCFVEPADGGGRARWNSGGFSGSSYHLMWAIRDVLLGTDPPIRLTRRAVDALHDARENLLHTVHPAGTVITRAPTGDIRWWTWAGYRANMTLRTSLSAVADAKQQVSDEWLRLRSDLTVDMWHAALQDATDRLSLPEPDEKALAGLKLGAALPQRLAEKTLAARLADLHTAAMLLKEPQRIHNL
jgi:ATP-dependent Lhr-like helicase